MAVYTVAGGTDDCYRRLTNSIWSLTSEYMAAGYNGATNKQWGSGMRFTGIAIPNGATILSAFLTLRANASNGSVVARSRISAEQVDDAPTFADDSGAFDTRWANRGAQVDWDMEAFVDGEDYDSVDFKAVIQAIVDRVGWATGQDIVIFWEDFEDRSTPGAGCIRMGKTFEHGDAAPAKLTVTYTEPGGLENKSASMGAKMMSRGLI